MKKIQILLASAIVATNMLAGGHNIGAVTDKTYAKECGSCHMAYQPGLLNKQSWNKMTNNLSKHFGTDASLEGKELKSVVDYLNKNSNTRSSATYESISSQEWFVKEHRKLPKKYVTQAAVKSWANCAACHTKAADGDYRERNIMIPNYGKWED